MPTNNALNSLLRNIYFIIWIISLYAIASLVYVLNEDNKISHLENELSHFHLPSMIAVNGTINIVNQLDIPLHFPDSSNNQVTVDKQSSIHFLNKIYALDDQLNLLNQYVNSRQEQSSTNKLMKRLNGLHGIMTRQLKTLDTPIVDRKEIDKLQGMADRYSIILEQLRRLHSRDTSTASTAISEEYFRFKKNIIVYGIFSLLIVTLIVIRIILLINRSIQNFRTLENELRTHQNHLEELVNRRTAKLEASNRELESYSYSIAHDLRTPLRSITSFSQIVMEDAKNKLNKEEINYLQRVVNSSTRMAKIIDEILQLSKITRNKLSRETINFTDNVWEIVNRFKTYNNYNHNVTWNVQKNLSISGDTKLIALLMDNLINNALKYSAKTPDPIIEIGCIKKDSNQIYYVKDNGIGFNQEYAAKLFQPFQRLHNDKEYEGMGIGLATAQRIVHRHGGKIWAEAESEKEATFYFTIEGNIEDNL